MKKIVLLTASLLHLVLVFGQRVSEGSNRLDLSGQWQFQIDRDDVGVNNSWFDKPLNDRINLPGSMPEKRKGDNLSSIIDVLFRKK